MSKKTIVAILFTGILVLLASCGGGDSSSAVTPTNTKTIDASGLTETGQTFPANGSTEFTITGMSDEKLVFARVSLANAKSAKDGSGNSNNKIIKSNTGEYIINPNATGDFSFYGSHTGLGDETQTIQIAVVKISPNKPGMIGSSLTLSDREGIGPYFIENNKGIPAYLLVEKALFFDLSNIDRSQLSKVVLIRDLKFSDGQPKENPLNDTTGISNNIDHYGFVFTDQNGKSEIRNSGVMNFSTTISGLNGVTNKNTLDKVLVYASYAANKKNGSGITLYLVPLNTITELNGTATIDSEHAAVGIELSDYDSEKTYALKLTGYKPYNLIENISLSKTDLDFRDYAGNKMLEGFPISYEKYDDNFYYYLGKLSNNMYLGIHMENEMESGNYTVQLIEAPSFPFEYITEKKKTVILKLAQGETLIPTLDTSVDNTISYTISYSDYSDGKSGELSLLLTGFKENSSYNYTVEFFDSSDKAYSGNRMTAIVSHNSTDGNKSGRINTSRGETAIPVRLKCNKLKEPAYVKITFTDL